MTGVLKTILFLLVIYYVWKLLFRLLFPFVAKKMMNKAQQTMEERMRQAQEAQNAQRTYTDQQGDVIVQKGAEKKKKGGVSESEGEYVEFEEIKE